MAKVLHKMRDGGGVTIVEFALVLPILALLLCATIEFGYYFFVQHTLQFATREGTRLALVGGTLNDPNNGNPMSRQDSIIQTIKAHASVAVNPEALQISIFPVGPGYTDPVSWPVTKDPGSGGDYMRVVVQYTFTFWTPLIGRFFPSGQHMISAQALYRNEMF